MASLQSAADTRLHDYLDDKLQTYADFTSLDQLISNVQSQQTLLKQQLDEAQADLDAAEETSLEHARETRERATASHKEQDSINKRLLAFTGTGNVEEASQLFEYNMAKIRSFEAVNKYSAMLHEVQSLDKAARDALQSSPEASIDSFSELKNLSLSLNTLEDDAQGAAPSLPLYIQKVESDLWKAMRDSFASDLQKSLDKMLWPKKGVTVPPTSRNDFEKAVMRLLALQQPELEAQVQRRKRDPHFCQQPRVLLPIEIMVDPIAARFRYHFSGDKPTNRLDKPEYFFSHFLELLDDHIDLLNNAIQPCLFRSFKDTSVASEMAYFDATTAYITSLLPMLRTKLTSLVNRIANQPQLLSHLIHELIKFDTTLREEWQFDGRGGNHSLASAGDSAASWPGLTGELLNHQDIFDSWFYAEKEFADSRYQSIIEDTSNFLLDYEDSTNITTVSRPTKAASRLNDLLATITSTYRPLVQIEHKLRFLLGIQIPLLERFHARLKDPHDAFTSMTGARSKMNVSSSSSDSPDVQGTSELERLCRVYGSAEFLIKMMHEWGEDLFFLGLSEDLRRSARRPDTTTIAGYAIEDIAKRTNPSLLNSEVDGASSSPMTNTETALSQPQNGSDSSLFTTTIFLYTQLTQSTYSVLLKTLVSQIHETLRPYIRLNNWVYGSDDLSNKKQDSRITGTTAELTTSLTFLTNQFGFLAKVLSRVPLRRLVREVARQGVDAFLFDYVLSRRKIGAGGAAQIRHDMDALEGVLSRYASSATSGLRRLREGVNLLNALPSNAYGGGSVQGQAEEDSWASNEPSMNHNQSNSSTLALSLQNIESRLFASNDQARAVLRELGMGYGSLAEPPTYPEPAGRGISAAIPGASLRSRAAGRRATMGVAEDSLPVNELTRGLNVREARLVVQSRVELTR
ncbi:MAG: hypothetical protein M1831_005280 [Alyxoria varia]|nr:MAG: hypothetical protein M1831_005280 [Alyxoria varia]